jgi:hypothetical protein
MIIVEYLHLKDDLGELWDFDENRNLQYQDLIFDNAVSMLHSKGFKISASSIKASGLNLDKNLVVEHYKNKELQAGLISPPFIIRSENLVMPPIESLEQLLVELYISLDPMIVDRSPLSQNYLDTMNFKEYLQDIDVSENTAILVIQSAHLSTSAIKGLGVGLIFAAASSSNRGHVQVGFQHGHQGPAINAYLIHKGSGELLWTNYSTQAIKSTKSHHLFNTFPQVIK